VHTNTLGAAFHGAAARLGLRLRLTRSRPPRKAALHPPPCCGSQRFLVQHDEAAGLPRDVLASPLLLPAAAALKARRPLRRSQPGLPLGLLLRAVSRA
jgi:hypothetical protein